MKPIVAGLTLALGGLCAPLAAQENTMALPPIEPAEWQAYLDAFVGADGRVIDTVNGDISHSESQGYGLLLALLAEDRAAFERIWSFTYSELMIRDDGLAAWMWDPAASPHVTDTNNATDGDILIAYTLALAGAAWGDAGKRETAAGIARAIARTALIEVDGLTVILPGAFGFSEDDQPDGPVVNLSYWIFEALPVLAGLTPEIDWMAAYRGGLALIEETATGGVLPSDWLALGTDPVRPAEQFAPEFGYNNIRVPLYLMRANASADLVARFAPAFDESFAPGRIDVTTGERLESMTEAGYRAIGAALACVVEGTPVPAELQRMEPTTYYAATLHLLTLAHLRHYHIGCLVAGEDPAGDGP